ncbi:MAG: hypothetical protein A3F68_02545 [Acidobacteria bacterium RIFCSPLOWO2_12_FULL_54_10]|nr:MAG: hypothetical protein A3F68_02545 [Acidobacteria bacterium RIFCSPLOWO2_12_FULL_54_10]
MSSPDPASVSFRPYAPSDFNVICQLDRLCFPVGIAYPPEEMAFGLIQPGAFCLVAESSGRVVAFLLACVERRQRGHIITIDIHPDFRRLGLGARLMQLADAHFREHGVARVLLEVACENTSAIRFYEKLGFTEQRVLPNYYRTGADALQMKKQLDG